MPKPGSITAATTYTVHESAIERLAIQYSSLFYNVSSGYSYTLTQLIYDCSRATPAQCKYDHYTISVRQEAVRQVESGFSQQAVGQQFGVDHMTLLAWLQRYGMAVCVQMCCKLFTTAQKQQAYAQWPLVYELQPICQGRRAVVRGKSRRS